MFPPVAPTSKQPTKRIFYVVGFKLEEAFETVKIKAGNFNLTFTGQSPTVREFLHELELESLAYETLMKTKALPPKEEKKEEKKTEEIKLRPAQLKFEDFRAGLLFCVNETEIIYQNPEDKETLIRIISGLSYAA